MTNQFEYEVFSESINEDGISSSGYKNRFKDQRYPAIVLSVEENTTVSVCENILSINDEEFVLENKTIIELVHEITESGSALTIEMASPKVAMLPASLVEDFISRETMICDIIKSPFRYSCVFSPIIENIPSSDLSSYKTNIIDIFDKYGNYIIPSSLDADNVFLANIDDKTKATIETYLTSMVLFITKEKVSSSYNVINNIQDNYIKNQLLTSITSHNTSRI